MNFKSKGKRPVLLVLGALSVVTIALVWWVWASRVTAADYLTATVERGNLRTSVNATGTLQAVTTVQVGSQVSGTISALYADFSSAVKKGQVIAQLDPALLQAQRDQVKANLEQARANLTNAEARVKAAQASVETQRAGVSSAEANVAALKAQRDDAQGFYERQASLIESGLITQREFESARTNLRAADERYKQAAAQLQQARIAEQTSNTAGLAQARAEVKQAQAQVQQTSAALRLAEVNLSHTTIHSPIDGVVVSRNVDVGQTVAASLQAPTLFTIANDLTRMQVIANIDQADIGVINESVRASFTVDAFPGQRFSGAIRQIRLNPQNVQNVVTYNVVLDVENPELKLKPGMTANLTVTIAERTNVLKLPNAALRFTPQDVTQEQIRALLNADGGDRREERQRTTAIIQGQRRIVWTLGADKQPQPKKVKLGITDGVSTEVVEGELQEGDVIITGQTVTSAAPSSTQRPPGFQTGGPRIR